MRAPCTVYPQPVKTKDLGFPWLSLLRPAFVFSQKVKYLLICRALYTSSMAHRPYRVASYSGGCSIQSLGKVWPRGAEFGVLPPPVRFPIPCT